ncbi:hypothetical protein A33Q_2189 [Indibacter alkaliphilus LW1]|uniref:Uncharacterized protein n=1 Tax=Indibacter alkaliphilus (strain CCUG 57479 / KCTC 22604 / LW1) TaxID=1189612 RepID=S2DD71_INDAL|nr:hypothetical protein A33Q_2189 [Indibacter alkaliphilus LW1]
MIGGRNLEKLKPLLQRQKVSQGPQFIIGVRSSFILELVFSHPTTLVNA